jgi:hypothetical protein
MTTSARPLLLLACLTAACTGSIEVGDSPPTGSPGGPLPGPGGATAQPAPVAPALPAGCALPPRRIWALTPEQYLRTVRVLLPGTGAGLAEGLAGTLAAQDGFSNDAGRLDMTEPHVGQLLDAAWQLAGAAAAAPASLDPCLASAPDEACLRGFVAGFGLRAFRRELAPAEVDAFLAHHRASDPKLALRELVMDLLVSPSALYRTELGPEGAGDPRQPVALTPFERASALSYFLTDGPPDAALLAAARAGALGSAAQIEQHTRRLLATPDSAGGLLQFLREGFGTRAVLDVAKDPKRFPEWKAPLPAALAAEAEAFVRQVVWAEDGKLSTLLTADFSMLDGKLAAFYGVDDPTLGADLRKVALPPGQRAGLFTQAAAMAALAKENDTDPVGRGKMVREVLLCQALPPPPATVNAVPPPPDGKRTQRERMAMHSADPTCATCHALMDPLGLSFERYDGIGRYRTSDVGQALEVSGTLTAAQPEQAPFQDAVGLMKLLASSPDVARCFVATAFRYAHGRAPQSADRCTLDRLGDRFARSGGNVIDLAVAITTDEAFGFRAGTP